VERFFLETKINILGGGPRESLSEKKKKSSGPEGKRERLIPLNELCPVEKGESRRIRKKV